MVIKETKIALDETNSRTRGNPNAAPNVSWHRRQRVANGDGVHAQDSLRHSRGRDHCRVPGSRAQPVASGRGRRAVGDRKIRSRRCAAAGRRLLGTAVALYGGLLPARYAQSPRGRPRSPLRADEYAAPAAGQAANRVSGCLALARTRILQFAVVLPGGRCKTSRRIFLFCLPPHCGSRCSVCTIGVHFLMSATIRSVRFCGVPPLGTLPSRASACRVASVCRLALIAALSFCTIAVSVPAGANKPVQLAASTA